jgi:GH24 family phage-related lysozyme (muramidase)
MVNRQITQGLAALIIGLGLSSQGCSKFEEDPQPNSHIAKYIANHEGRRSKVYDPIPNDGKNEPTIGVGHYLDRGDSREIFARILPEVDFDAVYSGKAKLNNSQIDRLFLEDLSSYINKTKGFFPAFDNYPEYLQSALVDGVYRGCLSGSPKTRLLINEGNFEEASKEYLNHSEYKNAKKLGRLGIRPRMENNRNAFLRYHSQSN